MTTLIAFDTSGPHCAAALIHAGGTAVQVDDMAKGQAEHLMPMLDRLMQAHGVAWADLDGIGVGIGPGNFTGIRISVAAARGLALGLGAPAIGISTFEAMAHKLARPTTIQLAAPRGQAYVQTFETDRVSDPALVMAETVATSAPLKSTDQMIHDLAELAVTRLGQSNPRPAPLYMRPADAAPPKDPAPVILT